jgi:hypothetical protein
MKETVGIEETNLPIFSQKSNEINAAVQPSRESHARRQTKSYPIPTKLIAAVASS